MISRRGFFRRFVPAGAVAVVGVALPKQAETVTMPFGRWRPELEFNLISPQIKGYIGLEEDSKGRAVSESFSPEQVNETIAALTQAIRSSCR